ncbi:unnamed protein product [Cylindrotheca closterium]|uniref:SURF1-like protein n=1 Tax=Cylindrotheca closterium TaxID=2856 RepID=A0AAD2G5Z5_9STRA|nr:unnamed protein product [Cylindrotheca closterium]
MAQSICRSHQMMSIFIGMILLVSAVESFQTAKRPSPLHKNEIGYTSRHPSRCQMSTADASTQPSSSSSQSTKASKGEEEEDTTRPVSKPKDREFDMPWSELQNFALRDNLSKYTVRIPLKVTQDSDQQEPQVFCLWRTMLREVPELAGYPIDFLQQMHRLQIAKNETLLEVTPGLLPYLEDYEFATAGGVSGAIYGVPGLEGGTRIQTSAVSNIEVTLPQGFVRTVDGSAAYEVGKPKRQEFADLSSSSSASSSSSSEAMERGGELLNSVANKAGGAMEKVDLEEGDAMLARLGASTAILLAGATAVNMLAHHLTVNVFWV